MTVDRWDSAWWNAWKLYYDAVIILRQQSHRILDLTGKWNYSSLTAGSVAYVIHPVVINI